jgi:hypothetical protein
VESGKSDGLREAFWECEEGAVSDSTCSGVRPELSHLLQTFRIKFRCVRPGRPPVDLRVGVRIDGRELAGCALRNGRFESYVDCMYINENGQKRQADLAFTSMVSPVHLYRGKIIAHLVVQDGRGRSGPDTRRSCRPAM